MNTGSGSTTEVVDRLCCLGDSCLGDILSVDNSADAAVAARVQCCCITFRQLSFSTASDPSHR